MRTPVFFSFVLAALLVAGLVSGCKRPGKIEVDGPFAENTIKGNYSVKIIHPVQGAGPNFLARLFLQQEDQPNNWYATAVTDKNGVATFNNVRVGEIVVDCYIPGQPAYYGADSTEILNNDVKVHNLYLKAQ